MSSFKSIYWRVRIAQRPLRRQNFVASSISHIPSKTWPKALNCIQLLRERLSEKAHATIPKGIVGGFEFAVLHRNLKEWHERPWTYVCECQRRATKEFLTATVPGTVYWSYQILPFGIVACTFLPTAFLEIAVYAVLSECLFWHSKRTGLVRDSTRLIVSAALLRNDIPEWNNKPVSGYKKGLLLSYGWLRGRNS